MREILLSMWRKIVMGVLWFFFNTRLYRAKSMLHRFFFDRKYRGTPIATYGSLKELVAWLDKQEWKRDGLDTAWDAVCTPEKVQAIGQGGDHRIGDCDEFAVYIVAAIEKSFGAGLMAAEDIRHPRFFTVLWMTRDGVPDGHNAALLEHLQPNGSVKYSYMDYALPGRKHETPAQVAVQLAADYAGWMTTGHGTQESTVLFWAISDSDLRLIECGFGDGWMRGNYQKKDP